MTFEALRLTKDYRMDVPARCGRIFPLLCPVREREWLPYWDCRMRYSASGRAETGCVFETDLPERGEMTWVVTAYRPPLAIQYTVFKAGSHVWNLAIRLEPRASGGTRLHWRHTFTGLTEAGNRHLSGYTDAVHRRHMGRIEKALVHFLATGTMIGASELEANPEG